jgi:glycosyltransferase involved in cell wall biosynthesis
MVIHNHQDAFFSIHNGVDKKTLFNHIAESEYFIYPLYTPYQDVHKDTFSCVVAEAIALGAIPVTYPLGALPENFENYCVWIDLPEGSNVEEIQKQSLTKDEKGIFRDNIQAIVRKIQELEQNPQLKEQIRVEGRDYILSNFNVNRVGKMWEDFIDKLV